MLFKRILGAIAVSMTLTSVAAAQTFVFTAIPDQDETRLRARFDQVATYLEEQLKTDVRYVPVKSYAAAVKLGYMEQGTAPVSVAVIDLAGVDDRRHQVLG